MSTKAERAWRAMRKVMPIRLRNGARVLADIRVRKPARAVRKAQRALTP